LHALTKDELHQIRRVHQIPKTSQLNKSDLVQVLHTYLLDHLNLHLERFDHKRYNVLLKVLKAPNSMLPFSELANEEDYEPMYFEERGFLFHMEGAVVMPREIRERLLETDAKQLQAILDRNTEWILLTKGLLFYYGNLSEEKLKEKLEDYTGRSINDSELWDVLHDLELYDYSIQYNEFGFSYYSVDDPERVVLEHQSRPQLDYYPFTKAQLLRAGEDDYADRHEAYRQFVSFLRNNWTMDGQEAEAIAQDLVDWIKQGFTPSELITNLQDMLEFKDMNQAQRLVDLLIKLMNHTRLWDLKGYSPAELSRKEQKHLKPLPSFQTSGSGPGAHPAPQAGKAKAEVYHFQTKAKVGRNDPCPCGSGKKFKKCCGS
jgi:hypothetical protein